MTRLLLLPLLLLAACGDPPEAPAGTPSEAGMADVAAESFGEGVPDGVALSPETLLADAQAYAGKTVVVEGVAREVCQQAGCWLTFGDDEGRTVRINVPRDETESYVFTFPKDAAGRTVRVTGLLEVTTESVEDRRHYAEDRGDTPDQIAAITEPRQILVLTALGAEFATPDTPPSGVAPA